MTLELYAPTSLLIPAEIMRKLPISAELSPKMIVLVYQCLKLKPRVICVIILGYRKMKVCDQTQC
jgi:hypothetical protein